MRGTHRQLSRASMFSTDANTHKRGASGAPSGASLDASKSNSARHHKRNSGSSFMSSIFPSRDAKVSASASPAPAPASTTMTAAEVVAGQTAAAVALPPPSSYAAGAAAGLEHRSSHRADGGADPQHLEEGEIRPPSWPNAQGGGGAADVVPPETPDALKGDKRRNLHPNTRESKEDHTVAKSDTELMIGEIKVPPFCSIFFALVALHVHFFVVRSEVCVFFF